MGHSFDPAGEKPSPPGAVSDWLVYGIPLSAVLTASLARLGHKSLWFDEALSAMAARLPIDDLGSFLSEQAAPVGLYYGLMQGWAFLGDSEVVLRLFSVVWALASVVTVVAIGRRLFGERTALIAGCLLGANAFFVSYAQEARAYTLAVFLSGLSSYLFLRAVRDGSRRIWVGYALVSALGLYAHYFAGLVLVAHAGSVVLLPKPRPWDRLVIAGGAVGALTAPLVLVSLRQPSLVDWVQPLSWGRLWEFVWFFGGMSVLGVALYSAGVVAALIRWRARPPEDAMRRWERAVVLAWALVPLVVALLVSLLQPVFVPRYLMVALPAVTLLVAEGLWHVARRRALAATAVALAVSAVGLANWYRTPPRQDWRAAVAFIAENDGPGDGLVPVGHAGAGYAPLLPNVSLRYYALRNRDALEVEGGDLPALLSDDLRVPEARRRVWVILTLNVADPEEDAVERAGIDSALREEGFRATDEVAFDGSYGVIRVVLYARGP